MSMQGHRMTRIVRLGTLSLALSYVGCGGGSGTATTTTQGVATPTVSVAPSVAAGLTTAQSLTVVISVSYAGGTAAGTVVLSSGAYASSAVSLASGKATVTIPAGLLATGTDTLTANFTSANSAVYSNASGSATVGVVVSGAALPVVTANSVTYATIGSPFRAVPLSTGNVLVSLTASTSGIQVFKPAAGGGLQSSCFNYLRPAFVADGAPVLGINLLPNGLNVAGSLGLEGVIFYNRSTLETCTSTGAVVSQGATTANEGTFDAVVTPDGKYAFVANEYGVASGSSTQGNIGVVALTYDASGIVTAGTLLGQIATGGQAIAGVTLSPDGTRLYVTSEIAGAGTASAGSGSAILTRSNCTQQVGGNVTANGLLTVIDAAKAESTPGASAILATVNAGCSPVRTVETADGSTLWVAARGDDRVLAFSTGMLELNAGNALLGYAGTGGTAPVGLRLFAGGRLLAVANSNRFNTGTANATVLAVSVPASASVVQTIPTGTFPREITAGADDLTLYLTNYSSQSFQVISTKVQ